MYIYISFLPGEIKEIYFDIYSVSALLVLFLHAFLSVPHLQPLEHFTTPFLKGQPVFLTVFLRLQEFLQEQVCDENKLFAMENGC